MKRLKEILDDKYHKICNVNKKGKCLIANVDDELIVLKEKNNHNIKETYDYLSSRGFEYYPKILQDNDKYYIYQYIEDVNVPMEQKAFDMMNVLSLLHNKTTFYKEMDINEYKELYEDTLNKIEYTKNYYNNLIGVIESHIFMSPSEYLIARNISKIFGSLEYAKTNINEWYELIKNTAKKRVVLLYNNMDINHIVRNKEVYLLNFEKSKLGIPIYDLYDFYIKYALIFDISDLLEFYENKYPLLKEEKILFYVFISIPSIINFGNEEYDNCKKAKEVIDLVYKGEVLISKNTKETNTE